MCLRSARSCASSSELSAPDSGLLAYRDWGRANATVFVASIGGTLNRRRSVDPWLALRARDLAGRLRRRASSRFDRRNNSCVLDGRASRDFAGVLIGGDRASRHHEGPAGALGLLYRDAGRVLSRQGAKWLDPQNVNEIGHAHAISIAKRRRSTVRAPSSHSNGYLNVNKHPDPADVLWGPHHLHFVLHRADQRKPISPCPTARGCLDNRG